MKLFQRLFFAAVLSGLAAGLIMSGLQQWRVTPLILEAELFEGAPAHPHADTAVPAQMHDDVPRAPAQGAERIAYTVLANVLAAQGFALLLGSISVLSGMEITPTNGLIWGLCGFIVFHLAPALGLPPELPGMQAADLGTRQFWWWGTAIAAGLAFYIIARIRNWTAIVLAAVLLLAPQVIGAPPAPGAASAVPAALAANFAASTLAVAAAFWLVLGPLYGWLNAQFASTARSALGDVHL